MPLIEIRKTHLRIKICIPSGGVEPCKIFAKFVNKLFAFQGFRDTMKMYS
nr:MAG TPA: hypothetical protein [Caudoviricetes sp.]